jgi:hypothetical protein
MENPETTFVYRTGPNDFAGWTACLYVPNPPIDDLIVAETDAEGLAQIKAALPAGRTLACEPALAAAGEPLGYTVRPLTPSETIARAKIWLNTEETKWYRSLRDHAAQVSLIAHGTNLALHAASFKLIAEVAFSVKGHVYAHIFDEAPAAVLMPGDHGMLLFESEQAMRSFQDAVFAGDVVGANLIPRWKLEFVRGSEGLQEAMLAAYGVRSAPRLMHDGPEGRRACDERESWRMGLVLRAVEIWLATGTERIANELAYDGVSVALEAAFIRGLDGTSLRPLTWADILKG